MGGSCSACKCKITKGKEFIDNEALGPQVYTDVADDEVLSCIARVKDDVDGEVIELEKCL
jgi:ferredoxin